MVFVNSSMRFRIVLDRLSVLLSSGKSGRIEDVSKLLYLVLTNSSYIRRIVLSAIRCWGLLGRNAGVLNFMKESIDYMTIFNTRYDMPNRIDPEGTNLGGIQDRE